MAEIEVHFTNIYGHCNVLKTLVSMGKLFKYNLARHHRLRQSVLRRRYTVPSGPQRNNTDRLRNTMASYRRIHSALIQKGRWDHSITT